MLASGCDGAGDSGWQERTFLSHGSTARNADASAHLPGVRRTSPSLGRGEAAHEADRRRTPSFHDPVGTPRDRQDDPRAPAGGRGRRRLPAAVRGELRRVGRPTGDGPLQDDVVPDRTVRRRGAPLEQGAAGDPPAGDRGRVDHADRRHHREPVPQPGGPTALTMPPAPSRASRAEGDPRAARARGDRRRAGDGCARRDAHRRRARPPRGAVRRRCPRGAHRPRGRSPAGRRRRDADRRGPRRRCGAEADRRLRPWRQPLRRRLRVHQEHARVRPGRVAVLARRG